MSSKRYAPLSIRPEFPYLQAAGLVLGSGFAAGGIVLATMPLWFQGAAVLLLLVSAVGSWRRYIAGPHSRRVAAAGRDTRGRWWVEVPGGARHLTRLLPDTTLFPGLIVLRFATVPEGTTYSLTLTPECVDAGSWRRVLVALRHENALGEKTRPHWGQGRHQA